MKTEEEYNTNIINLIYGCPSHQENSNCPFRMVREKEFNGRFKWINSLTLPTKKEIYQHHMACFFKHQVQNNVE